MVRPISDKDPDWECIGDSPDHRIDHGDGLQDEIVESVHPDYDHRISFVWLPLATQEVRSRETRIHEVDLYQIHS